MGELRGRADRPPEEPDNSASGDHVHPPAPEWNKTPLGNQLWRVTGRAGNFISRRESGTDKARLQHEKPSPADRPAERPPIGEELVEKDAPNASRKDKAKKQVMDAEFLEDGFDAGEEWGRDGLNMMPSDRPNAKAEVCVPMPTKEHLVQGPGMDGGELITGMLVAGIMIGQGAMMAQRMRTEWKERHDGRFG